MTYIMAWAKKETGTKHSTACTMAFGKLSAHGVCGRCEELRKGGAARTWNVSSRYGTHHINHGGLDRPCVDGGNHLLNAGGYCRNCNAGRDHS